MTIAGVSCILPRVTDQCRIVGGCFFQSVRYLDWPLQLRDYKHWQRPVKRNENPPQFKWDKKDLERKLEAYGGYTTKPLMIKRLGGFNPETGQRENMKVGTMFKWPYFVIDYKRYGPTDGSFLEEKVLEIKHSWVNTPFLALVAGRNLKRWIVATHGIKPGDIIRTSSYIPALPVDPQIGDAYPVGALPLGTKIHCVEPYPGMGAKWLCNAGMSGEVVRKTEQGVVIRIPRKEVCINEKCMVTVGQVSRPGYLREDIGSGGLFRQMGIKHSSGLWHAKDKWAGRGVKYLKIPPCRIYDRPISQFRDIEKLRITLNARDVSGLQGLRASHFRLLDMSTSPYQL